MRILILSLLAGLAAAAPAQPDHPIQSLTLDPTVVNSIPVAMDRLTTIRFPSPVSDLESALVGTEVHPQALFLLSTQPGSASFSVRALVPNTNTTLNVTWKEKTYVLQLVESRTPWLSVVFEAPPETPRSAAVRQMSSSRLLGLLDTAKAYGLLRQQHPSAIAGIEVARPDSLRDYGDYTIRIEEVFRFEADDTLVFRIGVSNKTSVPLPILPQSLMVRVGQRIYYQSIAEGTSSLPPCALVPIYFGITGSTDGSRNALSPKNDFMVLLARLEAPAAAAPLSQVPTTSTPPAAAPVPAVSAPAPRIAPWMVAPSAPSSPIAPVRTPPGQGVPFSYSPTPNAATINRVVPALANSSYSSTRGRRSTDNSIGCDLLGFSFHFSIGSHE